MIDFDSDKCRCYNHRDELNGTVQLLNFTSVMDGTLPRYAICMLEYGVLYIAPTSFIYTWDYVIQGNA